MPVKSDPRVPDEFRKGTRKKVKTVAALIAELQQLPGEMRVIGGDHMVVTSFGEMRMLSTPAGVRVVVTNYNDKFLAVVIEP